MPLPTGVATAVRFALPAALFLLFSGCGGSVQSTLSPAGRGAEEIARLFWGLTIGAGIVWVIVLGLAVYAIRVRRKTHNRRQAAILIIGGGAVIPTIVLAGYLTYALAMLPDLLEPAPEGSVQVAVSGEQWWWRVHYYTDDGREVAVANEVRLPVDEPVQFFLESPDVIHSFWIPSIGGKMDMIPGRINRLTLEPTKVGIYRGACAEYCGTSHALMSFYAVVMEREEFDQWLEHQAEPAAAPTDPLAVRGQDVFMSNGCGSCHAVRGTDADGVVGPDLTHVGSRLSLGAAVLPNDQEAFFRWVAETEEVKPGVHMPAFGMLPEEDLRALSAYLEGLK